MIVRDEHRLVLKCDDAGHAPGDRRTFGEFEGVERKEALDSAKQAGWVIQEDRVVCPLHRNEADGLDDPTLVYLRQAAGAASRDDGSPPEPASAQERALVALKARFVANRFRSLIESGGIFGEHHDASLVVGRRGDLVTIRGSAAHLLGWLAILPVERTWDRIEPPGTCPSPYGSGYDIVLSRTPPRGTPNDYERGGWRASLRNSLLPALDHLSGDRELTEWVSKRSIEWHIESPEMWAGIFAGSRGSPWWTGDDSASESVQKLLAVAMEAFASVMVEEGVGPKRRRGMNRL